MTFEPKINWKASPDEIRQQASGILEHYKVHRDDPWSRAYFDAHDPNHALAVHRAAQLMHVAEHGAIDLEGFNPAFDDREAMEEIARETQSAELAQHGVKASDVEVAEKPATKGGDEGPRSVADLRADEKFMVAYTDRYADPKAHEAAVAQMREAFVAESGGDGGED